MYKYIITYQNGAKEEIEATILGPTENEAIKKLKLAVNTCTYPKVASLEEV